MSKKLKLKIIEKFDTQADFAQTLGIQEAFVSRVLNGRVTLKSEQKAVWAKALDCDIEELDARS